MGYIKKLDLSKQKVYNQSVAARILGLVEELRLNTNEKAQRRWIWELLQNAKDVSYKNGTVDVSINYDFHAGELAFRHNGMPFSVDNITFLIEQVSTKEREAEKGFIQKTSGKFGTGFLTTHLLSETVNLASVIKEEELPYKKFEITLDRSGKDIESVVQSVNRSLSVLNKLDDEEELPSFVKDDFNTCFTYQLDDEGIVTARKGLEDLERSIAYVLVFVENINSIRINNEVEYKLSRQTTVLNDHIEIYTVNKVAGNTNSEIFIACISNENVCVAIEISIEQGTFKFVEPSSKLPRLFCEFPLVGTDKFNFPMVVNSPYFNPTESRDGVYLTDRNDDKITENKKLFKQAAELYLQLLEYASANRWKDLWVMVQLFEPLNYEWLSKRWYSSDILEPVREKLLEIPLVETERFGLIPIKCGGYNSIPPGALVDFPGNASGEKAETLWELCQNSFYITPVKPDYLRWSEIIWDTKYKVDLTNLIQLVEKKGDLENLSKSLDISEPLCIGWLNSLYQLIVSENYDKAAFMKSIIPNQNRRFLKKDELLIEQGEISDELKDILLDLGVDIREKLMDNSLTIDSFHTGFYNKEQIANEISKHVRSRLQEIERTEETRRIFKRLYMWLNEHKVEADLIFENLYKNRHKLLDDSEIVNSIQKAEILDRFIELDDQLSVERLKELLEIEELSKGFHPENNYEPDELQKRINFENGWKGEAYVYKMLLEKGLDVQWPNKSTTETQNVIIDFSGEKHYIDDKGQKFDLFFLSNTGRKSYVQVKTTNTDISRADEIAMQISLREWNFVNETGHGSAYYVARVFNINKQPEVYFMRVDNIYSILVD